MATESKTQTYTLVVYDTYSISETVTAMWCALIGRCKLLPVERKYEWSIKGRENMVTKADRVVMFGSYSPSTVKCLSALAASVDVVVYSQVERGIFPPTTKVHVVAVPFDAVKGMWDGVTLNTSTKPFEIRKDTWDGSIVTPNDSTLSKLTTLTEMLNQRDLTQLDQPS